MTEPAPELGPASAAPPICHVVFDWNGTLLDDCDLAVATVNLLRRERAMASISRADYRRAFRFPIAEFYRTLGFDVDGEDFPRLLRRYLEVFNAQVDDCPLHHGARETLAELRRARVKTHILSASQHRTLMSNLHAKQLGDAFDVVMGLPDQRAADKHQLGAELAGRLGDPARVLYVGDTDHDHQVAVAQGWRFALVEHGHQESPPAASHRARTLGTLQELLSARDWFHRLESP